MEGQRSICTDVYVSINFNEPISSFLLEDKEKGIVVEMKEILRDGRKVVYHGTPFFVCEPEYYAFDFKASCDLSQWSSFHVSLESDIDYRHVSNYYSECAPVSEAMVTQSILGLITYESKLNSLLEMFGSIFTRQPLLTSIQAAVELHFCERYEEV